MKLFGTVQHDGDSAQQMRGEQQSGNVLKLGDALTRNLFALRVVMGPCVEEQGVEQPVFTSHLHRRH